MSGPPDFDELVGGELPAEERERLRRVHDMLVEAGPPPELPDGLQPVPGSERRNVYPLFPKRRWAAAAALAAALAAAAFGAGYLVGDRGAEEAEPARVVAMAGTEPGSEARASLAVFEEDEAGNWPMELTVRGLEPLPAGRTYELWLTRDGGLADPCGTFAVAGEKTVVPLNAPYPLRDYDGWVIVVTGTTEPLLTT